MHIRIKAKFILLLAAIAATAGVTANAQSTTAGDTSLRPELAIEYNYVHSNAPPGDCGCINLNGGSATFAWPLGKGHLSLVGDVSAIHAGSISTENNDLTLSTYTVGLRYSPRIHTWRVQPWGQLLVGGAHASGSLVESGSSSTSGGAFASLVGGGVDLRLTHHFSIRMIDASYLVTTFDNGDNNHQNNARIGTGLVIHF